MSENIEQPIATDPEIVGTVDPQKLQGLNAMRRVISDLTAQIGQHEVAKARLLGTLQEIETQAQQILNKEAERLNIPRGRQWQITAEGTARLIPQQ